MILDDGKNPRGKFSIRIIHKYGLVQDTLEFIHKPQT